MSDKMHHSKMQLALDILELSSGDVRITFGEPRRDSEGWMDGFIVSIEEDGLSATARVENSRFIQGPEAFLRELAENWRGWSGEKVWRSLEGELKLTATSDSIGHIKMQVQLRPTANSDAWCVTSVARIDAGQLESLSFRAKTFFDCGI